MKAKPFLKWVGGKTQLLGELEAKIPSHIKETGIINSYIEPFVGGGALFFYLQNNYQIKKSVIIDNNPDLILTYKTIKQEPDALIKSLSSLQKKYHKLDNREREELYYKIRESYNNQKKRMNYDVFSKTWIKRASFILFLNRTCFNGLFRENSNGMFNVPHGKYKNPKICDSENIRNVSKALKNTVILCDDFSKCKIYAKNGSLVYFDPPYRPLNTTSSFTAYTKNGFCDKEQIRLASVYKELADKGSFLILSNSDPTNENKNDSFFDEIYKDFNINRVLANRMINCNGDKRGQIKELLIANY